tara:strand:- start:1655 stop:1888 length:234 start_codon:yes stop_codon:yes gene_type:complete
MQNITEKQILEWKEELKVHKERLEQAESVVTQETRFIAMVEGGIQFGEMMLKKIESSNQQSNIMEQGQSAKASTSKK